MDKEKTLELKQLVEEKVRLVPELVETQKSDFKCIRFLANTIIKRN